MAALLKKRALAEYSQSFLDCPTPSKKLHLVKKPLVGSSAAAFVGLLDKCKTSNDALQLLLRISDSLQFQESDIEEAIKKLSEHFLVEEEPAVRVKILSLFADIGLECRGANMMALIDGTVNLLKNETSHKVISQGISTITKLSKTFTEDRSFCLKLLSLGRDYLKDTSHQVKCRCLQLISQMFPICSDSKKPENEAEFAVVLKLMVDYSNSEDARVRREAFQSILTFHDRGLDLTPSMYDQVCLALSDDYEIVREVALKLVWLLGNKYPDNMVKVKDGESTLRLTDDAFVRICSAVNDLSMQVRALACSLLGTMQCVADKFLEQTLNKQLMSNMKRKRTAHERGAALVSSGEWASGRRWADDAPRELLQANAVTIMTGGAAGAFVHGLEDEFMEVRTAAVEAICQLSLNNPGFSSIALDFLVDMFNDEIEAVRLKAIDSLTKMSHNITLREDQLETIVCALEDYSMDVREGLHRMLGSCTLNSKTCLEMTIDKILENLKRYPQDKRSTYRCMARVGAAHAALTLPLVPRLLQAHPYLDMPQPDVEDPLYICILILVFNAAHYCSSMLQLLEEHTSRHYTYLRDTMPHLVPPLPIGDAKSHSSSTIDLASTPRAEDDKTIQRFFDTIMQTIESPAMSNNVRLSMLKTAEEQLNRLAEMEPSVRGASNFTALFVRSSIGLSAALEGGADGVGVVAELAGGRGSGPATLTEHAAEQLQTNCLRLQHQFAGLTPSEEGAVREFSLRVCALRLARSVRSSNSALPAAHALLAHAEALDSFLLHLAEDPDWFTISMFQHLSTLAEPKPGALAKIVLPLLHAATSPRIPPINMRIKMCTATILEPAGETDTVIKFAAGLVTSVELEAEVWHLRDPALLRVRVRYPDGRAHSVRPRAADLRALDDTEDAGDTESDQKIVACSNYRLLTKVLMSHGVWTESCPVEISLCLAVPDSTGRKETALIDLCKPVKVTVAPKPIKRGI